MDFKCPKCGAEASEREPLVIKDVHGVPLKIEAEWKCGSFVLGGTFHQTANICRIAGLEAEIRELTAENERLREALGHIQVSDEGLGPDGARHAACMHIAKVALEKAKP